MSPWVSKGKIGTLLLAGSYFAITYCKAPCTDTPSRITRVHHCLSTTTRHFECGVRVLLNCVAHRTCRSAYVWCDANIVRLPRWDLPGLSVLWVLLGV